MRARTQRKLKNTDEGVVVFGKKGEEYIFKFSNNGDEVQQLTAEKALHLFKSNPTEKGYPVSDNFEPIYQSILSKLFIRKQKFVKGRGLAEAIQKIEWIEEQNICPEYRDYTKDLLVVMRELGALPDYFLKQIRAINTNPKTVEKEYKELIAQLSYNYLNSMIKTAQAVNQGNESLILSEELSNGD